MYASIRRYTTRPGSAQAVASRARERFVPVMSQLPGFRAYYIVDAGEGVLLSISIFDDRESAEASNREARSYVQESLASFLPDPPEITAGEVIAHCER